MSVLSRGLGKMTCRGLVRSKLYCDPVYTHKKVCTHTRTFPKKKWITKNALMIAKCIFTCPRCLYKVEIKNRTHSK